LMTGIRIAHLTLKHRQGKNHKMRIVVFVGSPIEADEKDLVKLAKRLKKEKVNVDIVNFGESSVNTDKLTALINTINGKDGTGSHLVTVPSGPHLTDALVSSPVIQGEDGAGAAGMAVGGGFDPYADDDPELALALRVSMEEQRQRQEESTRRAVTESAAESEAATGSAAQVSGGAEEAMLQQALAMSTQATGQPVDFASMTEDEQVAFALQMSMAQSDEPESPVPMDTDEEEKKK